MSHCFYLGAYWSNRKESAKECADRLLLFLEALTQCDDCLAHWFGLGRSKKDALRKRVDVANRDQLLRLVNRGRNRADADGSVIEDLGFQFGLWNGADDDHSIGLSIGCGGYAPRIPNSVVIDFPRDLGPLKDADKTRAVLTAVAQAWEPEWAGVQSDEATESRPFETGQPFVDWMIYMSRDLLPRSSTFHPPNRAIALGNLGTIVVTQDEVPDPTSPEHVRNIDRARNALGL